MPLSVDYSLFKEQCSRVEQLCEPLINILKFKMFRFCRIFSDGRSLTLCSQKDFLKNYYENDIYLTECVNFFFKPETYRPGRYFWYSLSGQYTNQFMLNHYYRQVGVKNGLTLIKRQKNELLIYEFGLGEATDKGYEIACTQPALLDRFVIYFTEQLKHLPKTFRPIQVYELEQLSPYPDPDTHQSIYYEQNEYNSFLSSTPITSYFDYTLGIMLDRKDILCLYYLTEGQTSRQTATFVHLSHRTVEARLDKLRERLGCKNKSDLTRLAAKSDIRNIVGPERARADVACA